MDSKHVKKSSLKIGGLSLVGQNDIAKVYINRSLSRDNNEHFILYKAEGEYAAFPLLFKLPDHTLYVEFRRSPTRSHMDPRGEVVRMISKDGGDTWNRTLEEVINPDYKSSSGRMADANAYGWRYVSPSRLEELQLKGVEVRSSPDGRIAYASGCYKRSSENGGKTWDKMELDVPSKALHKNFRDPSTYLRVDDKIILRSLYGKPVADVHFYESWLLRSDDNGDSWKFLTIGRDDDGMVGFGETALGQANNGDIIALMRPQHPYTWKYLYSVRSKDLGNTWSEPVNTGINGYPAHLLRLKSGVLVCSYGYREAPLGIRVVLSYDNGKTWDTDHIRILRSDGAGNGSDLGYPISVQRHDGKICTIYYITTAEGITHVAGTIWEE